MAHMKLILLTILLAPLVGSLLAGFFGKAMGKTPTQWLTIALIAVSFALSCYVFYLYVFGNAPVYDENWYHWTIFQHLDLSIGILIDRLTVFMLIVVNFVSLMVHVYSIGYMEGDPGNQRFFCYISGFTFSMLSLVMANNFLLLFFGWEAVGLVSYLLIGFWFSRESANYASLKAFIANRVGDLGFMLGVAAVLVYFGTLDYNAVFHAMPHFAAQHHTMWIIGSHHWDVISVICILLFIGAIGKSAQIPLHIWLEGSMEGPTPISALIHAATMVTAGVFMVARLSPMFEHSQAALSVVLVIGAATCFFMGILGIVQMDIKRVIAYSTLSQLGYMMAAQGASAFSLGMFHLMSHAAFKALLFLSAGSVIVAFHHEQDMRYMGGLWKRMPITYVCMLIGALALAAIPPFSGFFSKDLIIEAVQASTIPGHQIASFFVVGGALITALYTFRMFFYVFHGKERMTDEQRQHVKESHWTITVPLILLAIPAFLAGMIFFEPALHHFFGHSVYYAAEYNVIPGLAQHYKTPWQFMAHAVHTLPFWLAISGVVITWFCYVICPSIPGRLAAGFAWIHTFLKRKYWVDDTYDVIFGGGARVLGYLCWRIGDVWLIDRSCVDGSGKAVRLFGSILRRVQSGYLYHYAFAMIVGLLLIMGWYFFQL